MNLFKLNITTAGFLVLLLCYCTQAFSNGSKALNSVDVDLFNSATQQPVKVKFWYQAGVKNCDAKVCLSESQNKQKVAIISHGAFGSPIEMNWLGYALASQGWLVAGIAHYGESWIYGNENIDPSSVLRFWQRPQEVSFVIDELSNEALFNHSIETNNILMLGHSSGGFTSLALAGAMVEAGKSKAYCSSKVSAGDKGCSYGSQQNSKPLSSEKINEIGTLQKAMKDPRITAVIALDPALGHAANEHSLKRINVPTLVIGSVNNDFLPFAYHAKYYADNIATAELIGIEQGAGHFVYINECDHNYKAQGVSLCTDREGVDRKAIQKQVLNQIFAFIYRKGLNHS